MRYSVPGIQSVLAAGTRSRLTMHVRDGTHHPEMGNRADSNVPKAVGGNPGSWRGLERVPGGPRRPRDQAETCGKLAWKREQAVTK